MTLCLSDFVVPQVRDELIRLNIILGILRLNYDIYNY